ncbi:MAG: glycoside hydrolase family 36 protein [Bacteroidota bacterium]
MIVVDRKKVIDYVPGLFGERSKDASLTLLKDEQTRKVYELFVPQACTDRTLAVSWKIKAIGVKGSWAANGILDKRFHPDWEGAQLTSTISTDAPILCLFGHVDENIQTFGCADTVNEIKLEAGLREEDNHFYCNLQFFTATKPEGDYRTRIYINIESTNFGDCIQSTADWMLKTGDYPTAPVPDLARQPLYSTWYSFHQDLEEEALLEECRIAKSLGYKLIIIDDGWQTNDDGRGYDYTGDWQPEGMADIRAFTQQVHDMDMGIMFWYSVPFCGRKSEAYKRFQGKFLTENHPWAPVFDPRFPEVRKYLVDTYAHALSNWGIDGFKLDFIDDFKIYPETELTHLNGRDTLSVPEGTWRLIVEIRNALVAIKPDVLIEFRQQFISPTLRHLGNMFRAFDCPNDSLMNRVRTTDAKLICGESAVHADMITWHKEEPLQVAALQLTSTIFSVPQISLRLARQDEDTLNMLEFFTKYWVENRDILLDGQFTAAKPLSNYPYLSSSKGEKCIIGLYEDVPLHLGGSFEEIDILNGKMSQTVILFGEGLGEWQVSIVDIFGEEINNQSLHFSSGLERIECPPNGIIQLTKKKDS